MACAYCKDTVILGSASQGVSNFKRHTDTKSHKNKRSAYHGLEPLEDFVCRKVVSTLDSSIFQILKSGKAFCKPCNHLFGKSFSKETLRNRIQVHINSTDHKTKVKSVSNTKTIHDFFKKRRKEEKTDKTFSPGSEKLLEGSQYICLGFYESCIIVKGCTEKKSSLPNSMVMDDLRPGIDAHKETCYPEPHFKHTFNDILINGTIRSTECKKVTFNKNAICNDCNEVQSLNSPRKRLKRRAEDETVDKKCRRIDFLN